jgi:hypothetical protein
MCHDAVMKGGRQSCFLLVQVMPEIGHWNMQENADKSDGVREKKQSL